MTVPGYDYAPFWCEENAIRLARRLGLDDLLVVFMTNPERTTVFASQRAGQGAASVVFWDYHVVVVDRRAPGAPVVWDFDSLVPSPAPFDAWMLATFDVLGPIDEAVAPRFRVGAARLVSRRFSSDRAHMKRPDGTFTADPPPWPRLGRGKANLARFLDLDDPIVSTLPDLASFRRYISGVGVAPV